MDNTIQPQPKRENEKRRKRLANIAGLIVLGSTLYAIYAVATGATADKVALDLIGAIGIAAITAAVLYGIESE